MVVKNGVTANQAVDISANPTLLVLGNLCIDNVERF
jgi:hypothetical protein